MRGRTARSHADAGFRFHDVQRTLADSAGHAADGAFAFAADALATLDA